MVKKIYIYFLVIDSIYDRSLGLYRESTCGLLGIYNVYFRSTQRRPRSLLVCTMYVQLYWDLDILGFLDYLRI